MKSNNPLDLKKQIIKLERNWAEAEATIIEKKKLQCEITEKIKSLKELLNNNKE